MCEQLFLFVIVYLTHRYEESKQALHIVVKYLVMFDRWCGCLSVWLLSVCHIVISNKMRVSYIEKYYNVIQTGQLKIPWKHTINDNVLPSNSVCIAHHDSSKT